jgi:hypothetical protein
MRKIINLTRGPSCYGRVILSVLGKFGGIWLRCLVADTAITDGGWRV